MIFPFLVFPVLTSLKGAVGQRLRTSPTRQHTMCLSYWTTSCKSMIIVLGLTLEVGGGVSQKVDVTVLSLGPSLLIEVNMQVRSMGPISEMDMVGKSMLCVIIIIFCRATSWTATLGSHGWTRGCHLKDIRWDWLYWPFTFTVIILCVCVSTMDIIRFQLENNQNYCQ